MPTCDASSAAGNATVSVSTASSRYDHGNGANVAHGSMPCRETRRGVERGAHDRVPTGGRVGGGRCDAVKQRVSTSVVALVAARADSASSHLFCERMSTRVVTCTRTERTCRSAVSVPCARMINDSGTACVARVSATLGRRRCRTLLV